MLNEIKLCVALLCTAFLGPTAWADATSSAPDQFQSDIYIEASYEDFCKDQNSTRACIEVTIKNESRATLDWKDNSKDGSLTGSGALDGFQVFEIPGCVNVAELPYDTKRTMKSDDKFTRRMREEKLHYWKSGRSKTIKVLEGCTYAVAVKREVGDHNWHFTYIPPVAESGCTLTYRYITSKADLKAYERWATFGAIGGGFSTVLGSLASGSYNAYSTYSSLTRWAAYDSVQAMSAGDGIIMEDALADGVMTAGTAAVVVVEVFAAYEAGLWSVYGIDTLVRTLDGKRDFTLGKGCY